MTNQEALNEIIYSLESHMIYFGGLIKRINILQKAIDRLELVEKENKKLKDENFRLYKELAEVQNISISSARGNFLYKYRTELENGK